MTRTFNPPIWVTALVIALGVFGQATTPAHSLTICAL